jgi:hypothetical protein
VPTTRRQMLESSGFAWPAWAGLTFWAWGVGHVLFGWDAPTQLIGTLGYYVWMFCGLVALLYFGAWLEFAWRERADKGH